MKQNAWIVLSMVTLLSTAQAASFDCTKAATKVEKFICSDNQLSKLDEELDSSYKTAIQKANQANTIRQSQKQWLKQRNNCQDIECLSSAYEERLKLLKLGNSTSVVPTAQLESVDEQRYSFQLTMGSGIPVCEAYWKRLNSTRYDITPACNRPESDKVLGFTNLNRVYLSSEEAHSILPRIWDYWGSKRQGSKTEDDADELKRKTNGLGPKRDPLSTVKSKIVRRQIVAWRYSPPVDIDNDSRPDNILMWQGYGLLDPEGVCGVPVEYTRFTFNGLLATAAFVEADTNVRLDTDRTMAIFGHPSGGYRFNKELVETRFRPIGPTIGIFEYQGLYYFDTFFDWRGDFQNLRQKDEVLSNTLGVFFRQNGKTKQICEYRMTDNQSCRVGTFLCPRGFVILE